jgi:putative acetyltransferase
LSKREGFVITGRSPLDGQGNPFPLLYLRYAP